MAVGAHGSQLAGTRPHAPMDIKQDTENVMIPPHKTVERNAVGAVPKRKSAMNVVIETEAVSRYVPTLADLIRVAAYLVISLHRRTGKIATVSASGCFWMFFFYIFI